MITKVNSLLVETDLYHGRHIHKIQNLKSILFAYKSYHEKNHPDTKALEPMVQSVMVEVASILSNTWKR